MFEALDRHEKIALGYSGGKDSTAAAWLLRPYWDRITFYHHDVGDLLPEVREVVDTVRAMVPHFVTVQGDIASAIAANGLPSDLVPHSAHDVGQLMAEGPRLVSRYACCYANLMLPLYERVRSDGNTLLIRGTKRCDMKRLPMQSGETFEGLELLLPLEDWSNAEVMAYLREQGAPISSAYDYFENLPECATCSAWWGERRGAYLRAHHPALYEKYLERLVVVMTAIGPAAQALSREVQEVMG